MKNNPLIFENEKCKNKGKRCYKRIKKAHHSAGFFGIFKPQNSQVYS